MTMRKAVERTLEAYGSDGREEDAALAELVRQYADMLDRPISALTLDTVGPKLVVALERLRGHAVAYQKAAGGKAVPVAAAPADPAADELAKLRKRRAGA